MDWIHIAGYLAAGLVFSTFCMKTMMPLRVAAIASNGAFIAYALLGDLYPILILHGAMLPLNLYRLFEIRRLVRRVAEASESDNAFDSLIPMMTRRCFAKGETMVRKGEVAHELFFLVAGTVRVEELGVTVGPGHLIGEIGLFAPDRRRTQTVRCETDVEALAMTDQRMFEVYFQNPKLGFHLMRLIVARLLEELSEPGRSAAQPVSSSVSQ